MGKYINFTLIKENENKKMKDAEQAMMLFELANKEAKIQRIEQENSAILFELAMINGGM